ncbi:MAG TPA: hypothetical protein VGD55_14045 [Acidothermaceae bacterium]
MFSAVAAQRRKKPEVFRVFWPGRETLGRFEVVDAGNGHDYAGGHFDVLTPRPYIVERDSPAVHRWNGAGDQNVDVLAIFEDVPPASAGLCGRVSRNEAQRLHGGVEQFDVVEMYPEVVIRCQDGDSQGDQRATPDENGARARIGDAAKK